MIPLQFDCVVHFGPCITFLVESATAEMSEADSTQTQRALPKPAIGLFGPSIPMSDKHSKPSALKGWLFILFIGILSFVGGCAFWLYDFHEHTNSWFFSDLNKMLKPTYTLEQLSHFRGQEPDIPIFVSAKGTVFDVSAGRNFYGPGRSYSVFAGKDVSRALATGCLDQGSMTHDLRGLFLHQLEVRGRTNASNTHLLPTGARRLDRLVSYQISICRVR